jgi:hypothetical protein
MSDELKLICVICKGEHATQECPSRPAQSSFAAPHGYAAGDCVEICDGSEAHGDKGEVLWVQDDGLIIVEIEAGCVWPVTEHELKPHNAPGERLEAEQHE